MADNVASALCYIPFIGIIISIVFLVIEPYNRNRVVRFHAFQALFLAIALFLVRVVLGMLAGALWSLSSMFFYLTLLSIVSLGCLIFLVYLAVMAYQGKLVVVPVVGPLAQQQAG